MGNVFFDVNDAEFTILLNGGDAQQQITTTVKPGPLALSVAGATVALPAVTSVTSPPVR